jgi:hypothetical protein
LDTFQTLFVVCKILRFINPVYAFGSIAARITLYQASVNRSGKPFQNFYIDRVRPGGWMLVSRVRPASPQFYRHGLNPQTLPAV